MARGLDASTTTAVGQGTTLPLFLVALGFDTTVYLSSRGQQTYDSNTYLAASLEIRNPLSASPTVMIYNESTSLGQTVMADGTAGRSVDIYQAYMSGGGFTTPVHLFSGEMSDATISDTVAISCKRTGPARTPRIYVVPPTFNHIPKAGTRINLGNGQFIILESN